MQRAARVREQYGGEAEYTHDFNLGNILLAHDTIQEIQQHQPHSVPWRGLPSRGSAADVAGQQRNNLLGDRIIFQLRRVGTREAEKNAVECVDDQRRGDLGVMDR